MSTVTLIQGDCLEILPTLATGSVDAVIADPPFGIGFTYNSHDDSAKGYGEWIWKVIELAESKCSPGSPIFVWQAMPNIRKFTEWFPRDWRIFAACKNFVQIRQVPMQHSYDPVLVWWTEGDAYSEGTASRDWHVAETSPSTFVGLNYGYGHPCPRPLGQISHIVNQWVRPGGTVLDPFMGSGTTGVACVLTGRNFIGIEVDQDYFADVQKRIADAQAQLSLLDIEVSDE